MRRRIPASGTAWHVLVASAAAALLAYVAYRAATLSFTHDEGFTYTRYVHDSLASIVFYEELNANNHLLNTLAMKLADATAGASELSLRAASVAAFAVYLVAIALILARVERVPARILGLTLAVANPYLLDFFSLARGYALAVALVAVSLALTLRYVERPTVTAAAAATTLAGLAALASFATLGYLVGVLVVIVLALVVPREARRHFRVTRLAAAVLVPVVGVTLLAVVPLLRLRDAGQLYVGDDDGFWQDTVRSLVSSTLYGSGRELLEVALVVGVAAAVGAGALAATVSFRRRELTLETTAFVLLAVPGLLSVVQHVLFDSLFLIERTALFFVPLFAVWAAFAADALARRVRLATTVAVTSIVVAGAAWINLAATANVSYVLDWRYDASTEQMVEDLDDLRAGGRTDLGVTWLFEPTVNFYVQSRGLSWLSPVRRRCRAACVAGRFDYYYVTGRDVAAVRARGARVVRAYGLSESFLARDASVRR